MNPFCDRMAVIGAGPCGLAMAKALSEHQIPYDQFEADDDLGGNWYHGVYSTTHIISSRKTTHFPDFPMPESYPDFPSRQQMLEYLRSYARHFNLRPQIQFRTKVVSVQPQPNERWELEFESGEKRIYKGVLVCNGHHWDRRFPNYPGCFAGEYIHSKDYQHPDQLKDKRVLVIGGGNSACDIASEAARIGTSCAISLRRGYWFLPKTVFGVPLVEFIPAWAPLWLQRLVLKGILKVVVGNYEQYGLPKPDHNIFEAHPTLNSELLHYLKHGRIQPKPDIARFSGRTVEFVDGTQAEFDLVVCATGYHLSFPFLPPGLVPVTGSLATLYGGALLPEYKHLYIIGTQQPRYGFGPLLTPSAQLLCQMIKVQDQMELPLGRVLKEFGVKPPASHLLDPQKTLSDLRKARRFLPIFVWYERRLRRAKAQRSERQRV